MPVSAICPSGWRSGPWLASVLAGTLVVTVAWLAGAEEPASSPLEDVKVDLKAIKRGNNSALPAAPVGPRISVPGFLPPPGETASPALPPAAGPNSPTGRKPANANWLLEAMELHARTQPAQGSGAKAPAKNEMIAADASDPAYLLKLYLAQDSPTEQQSDASSRRKEMPALKDLDAGILDGYLKQWIAPRDLALFGLDASAQAGAADLLPPSNAGFAVVPRQTPLSPAAPNPFLEDLKIDLNPTDLAPAASAPPIPAPPAAAVSPVPKDDSNSPAEHNPPPNSADDKKYFPQLKRF
jgi:hypothetical protein